MLKKNEVIEVLKNGGHIGIDTIYRAATVYDAENNRLDSCRYDTAHTIAKTDGFDMTHKSGWNFYETVFATKIEEPEQQPETIDPAPEQEPETTETRQERTDRENRDHCRRIAETLEAYGKGTMYRCPECGEEIEIDDLDDLTTETDDGKTLYRLPCGCTVDEEPEQLGLYDYFDDVFDIEYRIESDRKTVRSVSLMVACGGPNIYIDTAENAVMLSWWTDRARYSFDSSISDEINDWAQELWDIGQ